MSDRGHRFDPSVLREYDIRGIVGETLGEDDARALGLLDVVDGALCANPQTREA